jgi:hypothetical protein
MIAYAIGIGVISMQAAESIFRVVGWQQVGLAAQQRGAKRHQETIPVSTQVKKVAVLRQQRSQQPHLTQELRHRHWPVIPPGQRLLVATMLQKRKHVHRRLVGREAALHQQQHGGHGIFMWILAVAPFPENIFTYHEAGRQRRRQRSDIPGIGILHQYDGA